MENMDYCQSCGMPTGGGSELLGTNADGSKNPDYCIYCYKDGAFTADVTMEQMIDLCLPHMVAANEGMTDAVARQIMMDVYPTMKRWQRK